MHQFGWLSERGGNFLNLLQKEGVPSEKGGEGSNPVGNYVVNQCNNNTIIDNSNNVADNQIHSNI